MVIFISLLLVLAPIIYYYLKQRQKQSILSGIETPFISEIFMLIDDHSNLQRNWAYEIALYDGYLIIKQRAGGKSTATLKYSQISDVFYGKTTEVVANDGDAIGRAALGGLLFGGTGAIIGALTAGNKYDKNGLYFLISYKSSAGENKVIKFEDTRKYKGKQLANQLMEFCNISNSYLGDDSSVEL